MTICMLVEFTNRWWPFLVVALRYSYAFLDVVHPKDYVAVVSFDLRTQILTDFTQDRPRYVRVLINCAFPVLVNRTSTTRWRMSRIG